MLRHGDKRKPSAERALLDRHSFRIDTSNYTLTILAEESRYSLHADGKDSLSTLQFER